MKYGNIMNFKRKRKRIHSIGEENEILSHKF